MARPNVECSRTPPCGLPHKTCKRHVNEVDSPNYGKPCSRDAMLGQEQCFSHGGNAPQNKAAAAKRLEQQAAEAAVVTYGLPLDITPTEGLIAEVQWSAGHVAWLREKVRQIDGDSALVWGKTEHRVKTGGEDHGTTTVEHAAPSIWLEMYLRERKHFVEVCATALRAGVEERKVRLAESQGDLLAQVIRGLLSDLELTPEQEATAAEAVPRRLLAAVS